MNYVDKENLTWFIFITGKWFYKFLTISMSNFVFLNIFFLLAQQKTKRLQIMTKNCSGDCFKMVEHFYQEVPHRPLLLFYNRHWKMFFFVEALLHLQQNILEFVKISLAATNHVLRCSCNILNGNPNCECTVCLYMYRVSVHVPFISTFT